MVKNCPKPPWEVISFGVLIGHVKATAIWKIFFFLPYWCSLLKPECRWHINYQFRETSIQTRMWLLAAIHLDSWRLRTSLGCLFFLFSQNFFKWFFCLFQKLSWLWNNRYLLVSNQVEQLTHQSEADHTWTNPKQNLSNFQYCYVIQRTAISFNFIGNKPR